MGHLKISAEDYNRLQGLILGNTHATQPVFIETFKKWGYVYNEILWEIFFDTRYRAKGDDRSFLFHGIYDYMDNKNIENALKKILKDIVKEKDFIKD